MERANLCLALEKKLDIHDVDQDVNTSNLLGLGGDKKVWGNVMYSVVTLQYNLLVNLDCVRIYLNYLYGCCILSRSSTQLRSFMYKPKI